MSSDDETKIALRAELEASARTLEAYAVEARQLATRAAEDHKDAIALAEKAEQAAVKARRSANGG